jgi:hypothetical protein
MEGFEKPAWWMTAVAYSAVTIRRTSDRALMREVSNITLAGTRLEYLQNWLWGVILPFSGSAYDWRGGCGPTPAGPGPLPDLFDPGWSEFHRENPGPPAYFKEYE